MLMISRIVDGIKFGVYDTEKGTEQFVDRDYLIDIYHQHRIKIQGVEFDVNHGRLFIRSIIPQQDMSQCTTLQVKTKMLLGVDVRVFRDEITAVIANADVAQDGVTIRLSDFGHIFAWESTVMWSDEWGRKRITIIFDNNVKVKGVYSSMRSRRIWRSDLDIRELTDKEVVSEMYKNYFKDESVQRLNLASHIVDHRERFLYYRNMYGGRYALR